MKIKYISATDAYNAVKNGALLLDVRQEMETSDVWIDIENVITIPFNNTEKLLEELPKNKPIIICCAIGIVSDKAAEFLIKNNGYSDVSVLENGLLAWKLADLPLKYKSEIPCKCKCSNYNKDED